MRRIKPFICLIPFLVGAVGCKEIFQTALENDHVVLVAPGNGVVSADSMQIFFWQPPDSNINYEIQIVSPRFDSVVQLVLDSNLSTNQFQVVLPVDRYQWRVRAYNATSTTEFSAPWNITIQ
jgi:hypothetical protein